MVQYFCEVFRFFSWLAQHFGDLHRHFAWQAQHFRRDNVAFSEMRGRRFWGA